MKLIDRLIFVAIAVFLGALAVRTFLPDPVSATKDQVINVRIVGIDTDYRGQGLQPLPVNLVEIGSQGVWRDELINPQDSGGLTPQELIENWQRAKEKW